MSECKDHGRVGMKSGYATAWLLGESTTLHRVVFYAAHGYLPEVVRHNCDNPRCIEITHLEPGTQVDNMRDMRERGRAGDCRNFGEANGRAVLTDEQVQTIRDLYIKGSRQYGLPALARQFGVGTSQIWRIVQNEQRA